MIEAKETNKRKNKDIETKPKSNANKNANEKKRNNREWNAHMIAIFTEHTNTHIKMAIVSKINYENRDVFT